MGWGGQPERLGRVGWTVAGGGLLVACAALLWRALRADDTEFERLVGWATIMALVVAGLGLALLFFDRARRRTDTSPEALATVAREVAAAVLAAEREQRARLLGPGTPDTARINVEFYREMVQYRAAGGGQLGDLETVLSYYQSLRPGRLVITGEPGSGKTVLALHLLVSLLEQPAPATTPVPIRFSLSGFDTTKTLDQWLVDELTERFSLRVAVAEKLVRDRRILPVLDGLDEMDTEDDDAVRAPAAVGRLNDYLQGSERAPVIVTCRKEQYEGLDRQVLDATKVEVQPLTAKQISAYLRSQLRGPDDEAAWAPILDPLARDPRGPTAGALTTVLHTPWRLNLALVAARDGMEPVELLPPSAGTDVSEHAELVTARLLERYIPAATSLHPRRKGIHHDPDQVEGWLRLVAGHLA